MSLEHLENAVTLTSPSQPSQASRFSVRERPVRLQAKFCDWNDRYQLMRITASCGNQIDTEPYEVDGKPVVLSQQTTHFTLKDPGQYLLLNMGGASKTATITRTSLGTQHL